METVQRIFTLTIEVIYIYSFGTCNLQTDRFVIQSQTRTTVQYILAVRKLLRNRIEKNTTAVVRKECKEEIHLLSLPGPQVTI